MNTHNVGSMEVLHPETTRPPHGGPSPEYLVLQPGHKRTPRNRPIEVPTILERDHVLKVRDGTCLRADIYRPAHEGAVPAIIMYGPYGKSGSGWFNVDKFPLRVGIAESKLSGYEDFEGLDPAEWVPRGYAIVNVDARGIGDSEGDVRCWSSGEGEDGHDVVEEVAKLPWCSRKVAMAGNSWLAACQYYTAAQRPPHLACIAPLEGISDLLREHASRGGIPNTRFTRPLTDSFLERRLREDIAGMTDQYPDTNEYWEDKRADFGRISPEMPCYIAASFSTGLHTVGSFRAFEETASDTKWLVVHGTQEWHDLYTRERTDDLRAFFARYLRGIENGWEKRPRVRYSIINFDRPPTVNLPFADLPWHLPSARRQRLFFAAGGKLSTKITEEASEISYQADAESKGLGDDPGELKFSYVFPQNTTIVGPATVTLHVSCPSHNDMDIYVQFRKADKNGALLQYSNIPLSDLGLYSEPQVPDLNVLKYLGPQGMLRASRRHVSEELSRGSKSWKTLSQDRQELVEPGEIVRLDIQLWPTGMGFEAGESLVVKVSGHNMVLPEFEVMPPYVNFNKGHHIVHAGGKHNSGVSFYEI